jgi:hypothetical protein
MSLLKPTYDVIVAGGGIAGISAAVAAARNGATTLLIERYGFTGGMSTAGMVSPFMKYWVQREDGSRVPLVGGIFEEINGRMQAMGGMVENGFSALAFKHVTTEMLRTSGVDLALFSSTIDVERIGDRLTAIVIQSGNTVKRIEGNIFIDATGDAEVLYLANAPWVKGDEQTGLLQAMTSFFRVGGIDLVAACDDVRMHPDQYFDWSTKEYRPDTIVSIAGYKDIVKRAHERNELPDAVTYFFFTSLPGYGETAFNTTNILGLDGSSSFDLTQAEIEGRRQAMRSFGIIKRECPGFEQSYLIETGVQVGVRETRRAIGDYAVTGSDVRSGAKFNDAIARANYGVDIHGQKNEKSVMEYLREGEYYEIPVRSLIVKETENLLTAGRSISSTREGHAALRIQATSSATGEAAGLLASLTVRNACSVRDIPIDIIQSPLRTRGNI